MMCLKRRRLQLTNQLALLIGLLLFSVTVATAPATTKNFALDRLFATAAVHSNGSRSLQSRRTATPTALAAAPFSDDIKEGKLWSSSSNALSCLALQCRGGAADDYDDYDEEDEYDSEVSDDGDGDEDGDIESMFDDVELAESDFAEKSSLGWMKLEWQRTPPLTKAYIKLSFAATLCGLCFNGNKFPSFLLLEYAPVLKKLQLWRLITSFLNFGPFGLTYFMTAHFVWLYMSILERLNHNRPYDFWIMILFGQLSMVVGYPLLRLHPKFLGHNLSTFLVYIWSRYQEGMDVSMYGMFNVRAELLPWIFLAQTFLLEGEIPVLDFLGIVFGHVYHHCKTVGIVRAPDSLVRWYEKGDSGIATMIRNQYKTVKSDFEVVE